jgi:hypothetical protein
MIGILFVFQIQENSESKSVRSGLLSLESRHQSKRNMLLAYAVGYGAENIKRFIRNYQRFTNDTDDVVLFVKNGLHINTSIFQRPNNVSHTPYLLHVAPCHVVNLYY